MAIAGHRLSTGRVDACRVSLVTTRSFARTYSSSAMNDCVCHRRCSSGPLRSLERKSISPRRATSAHSTPNPENKAAGSSVGDRSRLRTCGLRRMHIETVSLSFVLALSSQWQKELQSPTTVTVASSLGCHLVKRRRSADRGSKYCHDRGMVSTAEGK